MHQSQFIEQCGPGLRSWGFIWGAMGMTFSCDFQLRPYVKQDEEKTSSYKHLEMLDKMTIFPPKTKHRSELVISKERVPSAREKRGGY